MKLEPELIKKLLEYGEDNLSGRTTAVNTENIKIEGFTKEQITFHVYLLWQNRYIECLDASTGNEDCYFYNNLTLDGYQYLELLKGKTWKTAQKLFKDTLIFAEPAIIAVINKHHVLIPIMDWINKILSPK